MNADSDQLIRKFNATAREFPADGLVHEVFEAQAARMPDAVALVESDQRLTYAQLDRRANQVAHTLLESGVVAGSHVGLYVRRSIDAIVGMLAILKAGGAYVPLDPNYPRERLAFMLADSAPVAVLARDMDVERVAELGAGVLSLDADFGHAIDKPVVRGLNGRSLAYVIYTSGSTGRPKGVMVEHRSVLRLVVNSTYAPIRADHRVAHCSSPSFDAATWEVWATLVTGARLVIVPHEILLDPRAFNRVLVEQQVTVLFLTVGLFNEYVDALEEAFGRLDYLITGGDVLNPQTIARALAKQRSPRRLISAYGPTETTTYATTYAIPADFAPGGPVPIGTPISNTTTYILDDELRPVPIGTVGEICIGGPGVARGYLNQPALTAERFVADPFDAAPGARMYRSGDLGRWRNDGVIEYIGRNDTQVKIRGFRVELGEIEAALQRFAGVQEALVVARSGTDGIKRLIAYVVPAARLKLGDQQLIRGLRAHLRQLLPPYMQPAATVLLPTLPLNANGKVDRQALPAPDPRLFLRSEYTPVQGSTEAALADLWSSILDVAQIGRYDDFVELGGDSIAAMKLIVRVADELFVQLTVDDVFLNPVLTHLAAAVELRMRPNASAASTGLGGFEEISI